MIIFSHSFSLTSVNSHQYTCAACTDRKKISSKLWECQTLGLLDARVCACRLNVFVNGLRIAQV